MKRKISLINAGLEGATVLLDLEIPAYGTGERSRDKRRVIAFQKPSLIMTISPQDDYNPNKIGVEITTPENYDNEFRKEELSEWGDYVLDPDFLREEWRLYRRVIDCYPRISSVTRDELENYIKARRGGSKDEK